jgi:hypothetical protein
MATTTLAATLNTPLSELRRPQWIGFWSSRTIGLAEGFDSGSFLGTV